MLFGDVKGCALIWDTRRGSLVYGLDHGLKEGDHGEGAYSSSFLTFTLTI